MISSAFYKQLHIKSAIKKMQQKYLIGTLFDQQQLSKKQNQNTIKLKDPMGNVRWKGAFTGGFQAGYKNTCGSKDGWVPATFVSSLGNRYQSHKEQNVLDFMDKEDLGREAIGVNVALQAGFGRKGNDNPFNISVVQSAGQKILNNLKKKSAYLKAPQNISQLQKLLQNYSKQQLLQNQFQSYSLKDTLNYASVGVTENTIPDDDFIVAYDDFFRKVIRGGIKQQTQQQIQKRREQNKVYFDFTKPLQQEPEYLKQIQDLQQASKPKKRRRNIMNDKKLKDLFITAKNSLFSGQEGQEGSKFVADVPKDYDPYHRVKAMKDQDRMFIDAVQTKKKHRIFNVEQRNQILGENRLAARFVAAGAAIGTSKFVKASQEETAKGLEKVFQDQQKNKRYWDYVMELQGKKISAQLSYLSYQEAEKQKQQFERTYRLKSSQKQTKKLPSKVEQALKSKNKKQVKVTRKTGFWKPQKLLCKRFGCVLPYKQQNTGNGQGKMQSYF